MIRRATKLILIGCNIAVGLFLLASCYAGWLDPQRFWFMGFFTLACFYFLLILLGFLLFWLFAKPFWVIISVTAIGLCWKPLREVVAIRKAVPFHAQKNKGDLRVMSWNVEHFDILEHKKHPEIKNEMLDLVRREDPDVACFQEMVASDQYPSAINYLPEFMKKMGMADYHYSYNPRFDFDNKHHFGIISFSKYPIVNKRTEVFSPNDYNSTFQFIDIVKEGDTIRVFNAHLQSLKFSNENRRYIETPSIHDEQDIRESKSVMAKFRIGFYKRKTQSDHLKQVINESPYPVIVCGDFNDVPNSYAYRTVGKNMLNAFTEKGSGIGRTFFSISPTLRIDNIFAGQQFDVSQFARIQKKLSDHFPIIADLHLTPGAGL